MTFTTERNPRAIHRDLIPARARCIPSQKFSSGKYDTPEYPWYHDFPSAVSASFAGYCLDIAAEEKFQRVELLQ